MTVTPSRSRSTVRMSLAVLLVVAATLASPQEVARAAVTGLESRLYVANDEGRRIDVFDVSRGHALHHSITSRWRGHRATGVASANWVSIAYPPPAGVRAVVA